MSLYSVLCTCILFIGTISSRFRLFEPRRAALLPGFFFMSPRDIVQQFLFEALPLFLGQRLGLKGIIIALDGVEVIQPSAAVDSFCDLARV